MSERVVTTQQLEAWAAAIKLALSYDDGYTTLSEKSIESLHQALEDMGEVMADAEVEEVEEDPQLYDPDAATDGWEHGNEIDDVCDGKDQDVWYL